MHRFSPALVRSQFESLEQRRLLASINIADFGAIPDDGQDDSAAIQAAIDASRAGDVINFGPGTYDLHSTVKLRSNREYKGWNATLKRHGENVFALETTGHNYNITISSLTLDGGGFMVSGENTAEALLIRDSTFKNISGGYPTGNGVFLPAGMINSKITRSTFQNILGETGIYGFKIFHNSEISHNYFEDVFECIHTWHDAGSNFRVIYNEGVRTRRMGIELQGHNSKDMLVEGNRFRDWVDPYHGSFGLSIMNKGEGTIIRNNILRGPHDAPVGIEVAGVNGIVENNIVEGFREGIHIVGATGTHIRYNKLTNQKDMAIWRTGVDEARDVRIYENVIRDPGWTAFVFHKGNSEGTVVENNLIQNASRRGKGLVAFGSGALNGVRFSNNTFKNVDQITDGDPGGTGEGNIAIDSGGAWDGWLG